MTTTSTMHIREPFGAGLTRVWELDRIIWEGDTAHQHVVIADTAQGRSLFCDNDRQSTEFSQLVYHEALLTPALLLADRVRTVLIVGSSEGVASRMAVAAGAAWVDHVDIDAEAVALCAEHLPYGYTVEQLRRAERGDGPIRVHYTDGWKFLDDVVSGADRYDIVLVDLPDEREEPAQHNRLYGAEFLQLCRSALADGGVVGTQAGCQTLWRNATLLNAWRRFGKTFPTTVYYGSDEHEWAFLFGRADDIPDPTELMVSRIDDCAYHPQSVDEAALRGNGVPPFSLRHAPNA